MLMMYNLFLYKWIPRKISGPPTQKRSLKLYYAYIHEIKGAHDAPFTPGDLQVRRKGV